MSNQVGRITGPLLSRNLIRNGIDLKFRNTLSTTPLLYLDVNNKTIGIDKSSADNEDALTVDNARTTDLISDQGTIDEFAIESNNISVQVGDINLNAGEIINLSKLEVQQLFIDNNTITGTETNGTINLDPNGTGTVEVFNDLNVTGNIFTPGNLTFGGNITFGDRNDDNIVFNAELENDLVPDQDDTFNLGSTAKRFSELHTELVNGTQLNVAQLQTENADFALRPGNAFFVSTNGDDANSGDSPQSPFRTIKHALDNVDASTEGPVTILVYPGEYQEQLPLEVPTNTSIQGLDIRSTIVLPTSDNQSEDVFLMNGESTVQNLTIKDFFYDNINDKGYAFRFASNAIVTSRSPYIQNITVITQGSSTPNDDPRGFAAGDAGKGALVDGADVLNTSRDAAMLFHSVTFITPGVDALTLTNGVRVEWLNSFSYFANRGIYIKNGVTGHLSTDGSTVLYGGELRSIGSANVYGNIGAEADGDDCIAYLIMHNFAYVGAGKLVDNDPSRAIQANEVIESNSGRIYYQSMDHLGNFRVGEQFVANQETGETNLTLSEGDIDAIGGLRVTTNGQVTKLDGGLIETGNFRFSGNTIETLAGEINIDPFDSNPIRFTSNVNMLKNLVISGSMNIDGAITRLGDNTAGFPSEVSGGESDAVQTEVYDGGDAEIVYGDLDPVLDAGTAEPLVFTSLSDTVTFNARVTNNIEPDVSGTTNLGNSSTYWKKIWLGEANISDVRIQENFITTTVSNADLDLVANGSGQIYIGTNDVESFDLTTEGLTSLQNTNITGNVSQTGNTNVSIPGTLVSSLMSNFSVSNSVDISADAQLENILISGNLLQTTQSNSDLDLRASGTGVVRIQENASITNNLDAGNFQSTNTNISGVFDLEIAQTDTNDIKIFDNVIQTSNSNSDIELRTLDSNNIILEHITVQDKLVSTSQNDLTFNTSYVNTNSNKALKLPIGADNGRNSVAGSLRFNNNFVTYSQTLKSGFQASTVNIITNTPGVSISIAELEDTGRDEIQITQDYITIGKDIVEFSNDDFNGGPIRLLFYSSPDVYAVNDTSQSIGSRVFPHADSVVYSRTGTPTNSIGTGSKKVAWSTTGSLETQAYTEILKNKFEGYTTGVINFDGVRDADLDTTILTNDQNQILFTVANTPAGSIYSDVELGNLAQFNTVDIDNTRLTSSSISTTRSNSDLVLNPIGTGVVTIDDIEIDDNKFINNSNDPLQFAITDFGYYKVDSTGAIRVPTGTTAERGTLEATGELRFNSQEQVLEAYNGTEWILAAGGGITVTDEVMQEEVDVWMLTLG